MNITLLSNRFKIAILAGLMVGLLASCSTPTTVSSPGSMGSLAGQVLLQDSAGNLLPSNGVSVRVEGTNWSGLTDSLGGWHINNVLMGTYDITATKQGFGTLRWFGVTVLGPGTTYTSQGAIEELPTTTVTIDSANSTTVDGKPGFRFEGRGGPQPHFEIIVFLDRTPNVNPEDAHLYAATLSRSVSSTWTFEDAFRTLKTESLPSGSILYASAALGAATTYDDPGNLGFRYSSCGPKSNVVAFTIP